jgi:hypothetical protein
MDDLVIVTINPTSITGQNFKVVAVHHKKITKNINGDDVIKVEGTIVDACYTFEDAIERVKELES